MHARTILGACVLCEEPTIDVTREHLRMAWMTRTWRTTGTKNQTTIVDGTRVTIYVKYIANTEGRGGDWGPEPHWFYVVARPHREPAFSVLSYHSIPEAKNAAFEHLFPTRNP